MKQQENKKIKIAALADIHVTETAHGSYRDIFAEISDSADIFLLCGDLTDLGQMKEAEVLVQELSACRIPVVAVLGNHDFEGDQQEHIEELLRLKNVNVLYGTDFIFEKNGKKIAFTGAKGFGGGFKPAMWRRFGEPEQKAFYDAVAGEVQHLENGLDRIQRLDDMKNVPLIVLLHFSPIRDTLKGEPEELYPFLGSTRLEEVIDRYPVTAVIHGHAHFGSPTGKTEKGIPVYNVAYPLMKKTHADKPYLLLEV